MIEFRKCGFIFRLEQDTITDSNCTLKIFDESYNLIKTKCVSIGKLSDFILTEFYK